MRSAVGRVALLLFGSGFCALVYQTAWLRMFRLVFGASTAASAAVLAIFMAGLGLGGLLLGRRADRHPAPLGLYAQLEAGIAVTAGLSPWLMAVAQWLYIELGGSPRLGLGGSTVVRLVLSTLVLAVPTFLMGGTLPAVARAVERSADSGRRVVGLLYAVNTLGAVLGTLATTFFSLEALGVRKSIWIAALLNLVVVLAARSLAREMTAHATAAPAEMPDVPDTPEAMPQKPGAGRFVTVAAAVVGFAFLLMELVWYRMLGPLLGGSSYTFGLILAVALLGIGAGGLMYGRGAGSDRARRPSLLAFAGTCSLEALFLVLPFALGDRLAVLAALLRPLAGAGFLALVGVWTVVTAVVVLPAAVVAGYQFPLLIALLGAGRRQVGREVGITYAANTLGAIARSNAGGFGLIPWLSAPGVWRLVVVLLLGLAGLAIVLALAQIGLERDRPRWAVLWPVAAGVLGLLGCLATGPTAFWRHSPIGAGRVSTTGWIGPNEIHNAIEGARQRIVWEADGVESSVALDLSNEYSFVVNGKSDGSALADAPTQVMSGLVGALLHPGARRVLVIGLGSGSTAGWLAHVPTVERVDVVELEPAIVHVARTLSKINRDVLSNPKVHLVIGDGREVLLTTPESYDIIFSEPSNPYRAGVASLFSADFYRSVRRRLRPGGLFLQWLQGYELDAQVVRTAIATMASEFPAVESWRIQRGDLMLMGSEKPVVHDLDRIRGRIGGEPYRTALARTWGVDGIEGLYAGYLASPAFARAVRQAEGNHLNTDDRSILEFGFARNLGRFGLFRIGDLVKLAARRGENRPATTGAPLDWSRVDEMRAARSVYWEDEAPDPAPPGDAALNLRAAARRAGAQGHGAEACTRWFEQPEPPRTHADLLFAGECLADSGDPRTPAIAAGLAREQPIEADLVLARWAVAAGRPQEAGEHLLAAFQRYHEDPWVYRPLMDRSFRLVLLLARRDHNLAARLFAALERPFAVRMFDGERRITRVWLSRELDGPPRCAEAIAALEPHVPWDELFLANRYECYQKVGSPRAGKAGKDLEDFLAAAPSKLAAGL
jgi:spermidine synthase